MILPAHLRASTKERHDKLEHDLNLLNDEMTLEDYKLILLRFYGLYASLEKTPSFEEDQKKLPRLEEDLAFFAITDFSNIPVSEPLDCRSLSEEYGVRYVIEGSAPAHAP